MDKEETNVARPRLSIGVVTHDRSIALTKLLQHLIPTIVAYGQTCEVIVANNSGSAAHEIIESIVVESGLRSVCECRVIDSHQNNISTGRNIILNNARELHLVFIDDDEYPALSWLVELVDGMNEIDCTLVAGPIQPVFPSTALDWVKSVDLHNAEGLQTGDRIDYAASGNFLMYRKEIEEVRFNESFGKSGGEDTEFFLKLKDKGHELYWCSDAIVYEDIPAYKSTPEYMIQRFKTQGRSYRVIMESRGGVQSQMFFICRAALLAVTSIIIANALVKIKPVSAAKWMKRGYSNLGKIIQSDRHLYE